MSTSEPWGPYCSLSGIRHDKLKDYSFCGQCGLRNPSVPGNHPISPSTEPTSTSQPDIGTNGLVSLGSVPSPAESERQLGFISRQPPLFHAGSKTLFSRKALVPNSRATSAAPGTAAPAQPKRIDIEARLWRVEFKADQHGDFTWTNLSEPPIKWKVPDTFYPKHQLNESLIDYVVGRCKAMSIRGLKDIDNYHDHGFIQALDIETNEPEMISECQNATADLEELLEHYDSTKPSARRQAHLLGSYQLKMMVVLCSDERSRQLYDLEYLNDDAEIRKDERARKRAIREAERKSIREAERAERERKRKAKANSIPLQPPPKVSETTRLPTQGTRGSTTATTGTSPTIKQERGTGINPDNPPIFITLDGTPVKNKGLFPASAPRRTPSQSPTTWHSHTPSTNSRLPVIPSTTADESTVDEEEGRANITGSNRDAEASDHDSIEYPRHDSNGRQGESGAVVQTNQKRKRSSVPPSDRETRSQRK